MVIVRSSPVSQTNQPEAQGALLLDFNIRDCREEEKQWSAIEYTLREVFSSAVCVKTTPGCQARVNVFVLMSGADIEAAIVNACIAALLKLGLPISAPVYAISLK